ncbi:hypothetical protein ACFL2Q_04385 [Thermodesulfobacteriota bacterium]
MRIQSGMVAALQEGNNGDNEKEIKVAQKDERRHDDGTLRRTRHKRPVWK